MDSEDEHAGRSRESVPPIIIKSVAIAIAIVLVAGATLITRLGLDVVFAR